MKNIMLLIIVLSVFTNVFSQQDKCQSALYSEYLISEGRTSEDNPSTNSLYNARCIAFTKRWYELQKIKAEHQSPDAAFNKFAKYMDLTQQQHAKQFTVGSAPFTLASTNGYIRSVGNTFMSVQAVPTSLDYRTLGMVSSIKDQGSCGCCWSFTTTGLYESFMMFKGQAQYDLSEQYILQCTSRFTKNVVKRNYVSSCSGGYVDFAGQLARINGIPKQTAFPYISKFYTGSSYPKTSGICQASQTYLYARNPSLTTFNLYKNITNTQLKALLVNGPVGALIYANTAFSAYKSGVFSSCPTSAKQSYDKINHAVIIVGFTLDGDYIIKNSWGTSWGESGFGTVLASRDCGLSAFVYQYESPVPAGSGLVYFNQVALGAESGEKYIISTFIISILMILGLLF